MPPQKKGKTLTVFLSHASEDKPAVKRLWKRLQADGFDPWLDEEKLLPGQDWGLEIEKAMRQSDVILLCFSTVSVAKEGYIQREFKRAMDIQLEKPEGMIFVIPVRLDDCEMPNFIRDLHWVDYPADYDRLLLSLQEKSGAAAMPRKTPKAKSKKSDRKSQPKPSSGGHTYNIGTISAGRVVVGDQTNYHIQTHQIFNITSTDQFIEELKRIRAEIEGMKSQPGISPESTPAIAEAQAGVREAIQEAEKAQPAADRILSTLLKAREAMDTLGGSISSAVTLGTTLGHLAGMVIKLFGG